MGSMKALLALLLATLYVASRVAFPLEEVEAVGLVHLEAEPLLLQARLLPGEPWLWVGPGRLAPLGQNPWIAEARLEKPRPGAARLWVRERRPFLPLPDGSALAEDGTLLPGGGPLAPGPRVEGKGPLPKEALLALARAYPEAQRLRYTPAGLWVDLPEGTLFAPEPGLLLEYAQAVRPKGEVYLYAWGVSVRP
ncbi:FtsQ-type POTRA domain-containing protein [Thermus thermamylovorans]|uniref:FtsQ-type POTRA domain-containing protein n=1 Tax=Thermus thermamylovorans TaxID=2509362 RepID=A0A4Q9B8M4_9DEIN|nr:FtsQ-type POTRA domain-containing protein [Thermus thermamylovorans]TBH21573.1 FtsQ-type POTRA domain-containing protein [Thermus thermamylovorans]